MFQTTVGPVPDSGTITETVLFKSRPIRWSQRLRGNHRYDFYLIRIGIGNFDDQILRSLSWIAGQPGSDLAWYVNGLLVPELFLRREFTYSFQVEGGDDPHSPTHYHPLIITDEPVGGYEQMTEEERKKTRVLAGVEFTRRGQPRPTAGTIQNPLGTLKNLLKIKERTWTLRRNFFFLFAQLDVFACGGIRAKEIAVWTATSLPIRNSATVCNSFAKKVSVH